MAVLRGVGPGAGTIKYRIPDAHSDFIFAVAGEEFGLVLCGLIALLFCVLTVRLLLRSAASARAFRAAGGRGPCDCHGRCRPSSIWAWRCRLLPAKGMTLPFISYGGSSLFAVALTMGFALAVTRQRPQIGSRARDDLQLLRGSARMSDHRPFRGRHGRASVSGPGAGRRAVSAAAARSW